MEIKNDSQNALVEWIGTGSFFVFCFFGLCHQLALRFESNPLNSAS